MVQLRKHNAIAPIKEKKKRNKKEKKKKKEKEKGNLFLISVNEF